MSEDRDIQGRLGLREPAAAPVEGVLEGEVVHVTYQNETSGFRVLKVRVDDEPSLQTVVGVLPSAPPGTRIRATGGYQIDRRHGRQFRAETLLPVAPSTLEGVERYLGSGLVPGIGKAYAKRIVKTFGERTLEILDRSPERLQEVPGLGARRASSIAQAWSEHRGVGAIMVFLQSHGASPSLATRIYKRFGPKAVHVVSKSPYRLALDVWGVGFKTADTIARSLGVGEDAPERAQAGVMQCLHDVASAGHVYTPRAELTELACQLLDCELLRVEEAIEVLSQGRRIVVEDEAVMLPDLRRSEHVVAERIGTLLADAQPLEEVGQAVETFERMSRLSLADTQREALEAVAHDKVVVITGGPGVGKTTIVRAVLALFDIARMKVALAAPTGRAAKRMGEATGREAKTIHRLLEIDPKRGRFQRNRENPLEVDALIVDETSMVAIDLAESLLLAVPDHARVVLVGDVDQLPSVGPGAVLRDVIDSGCVPTVRLTRIFRQAEGSGIVENAHRIHDGEPPVGGTEGGQEFYVIERRAPEDAVTLIDQLVSERVPKGFGLHPVDELQVLTPMQKGPVGAIAINERLQQLLNPSGPEVKKGARVLREGDKVMQIANDYDKDVFNGDIGRIRHVDVSERKLSVRFEGREVVYEDPELDALTLAYATSIHKSQGSEYPAVIVPVLTAHFVMLSRNLLYTAVTRGKRLVVLVADPRALSIALGETRKEQRRTLLAERIRRAHPA